MVRKSLRQDARAHRERLIAAAARVFEVHGYRAALGLVLAEAELGRGTLYRHFPNRLELTIAVLERELRMLEQLVEESPDDPDLIRMFLRRQGTVGSLAFDFFGPNLCEDSRQRLQPLMERADRLYERVISQARRFGHVDAAFGIDHMHLIVRMLIAASDDDCSLPNRARMDVALDILLRGIADRDGKQSIAREHPPISTEPGYDAPHASNATAAS